MAQPIRKPEREYDTQPAPAPVPDGRRGPRHGVSVAIATLASVTVGVLVIQVLLVGIALFVDANTWRTHGIVGHVIELLAFVALVLSLAGRQPPAVRWRALALLLLVTVQGALGAIKGVAGAFHPVNAILLFWVTLSLARHARAARDTSA